MLGNKKQLTQLQDEFNEHVNQKGHELERGQVAKETGRVQKTTNELKQEINQLKKEKRDVEYDHKKQKSLQKNIIKKVRDEEEKLQRVRKSPKTRK